MKILKYDTNGDYTYEHNGVTFRCTSESIIDALMLQGVNILDLIERCIDSLVSFNKKDPIDYSVRLQIFKNVADDGSSISYEFKVSKKPRLD